MLGPSAGLAPVIPRLSACKSKPQIQSAALRKVSIALLNPVLERITTAGTGGAKWPRQALVQPDWPLQFHDL